MYRPQSRHIGYVLLGVGAFCSLFSIESGSRTLAACPGITLDIFHAITSVELIGSGFSTLIAWHNGCNTFTHPFIPLVVGIVCLLAGVLVMNQVFGNPDGTSR